MQPKNLRGRAFQRPRMAVKGKHEALNLLGNAAAKDDGPSVVADIPEALVVDEVATLPECTGMMRKRAEDLRV